MPDKTDKNTGSTSEPVREKANKQAEDQAQADTAKALREAISKRGGRPH